MENMANHLMTKQVQVGLLLAAVRRRQRQAVEARVGSLGLSSQQFWILEAIAQRGECLLGEILAVLPMDQPTSSRVLAALRERELVTVENDSDDRRRRTIGLTARGAKVARRCAEIGKQIRKAIIDGFSQHELAMLSLYLHRLVENLDHLDAVAPPQSSMRGGKGLAKAPANDSYRDKLCAG
jgi:DNA-binding MarR family transcriptional regulator